MATSKNSESNQKSEEEFAQFDSGAWANAWHPTWSEVTPSEAMDPMALENGWDPEGRKPSGNETP